MNVYQINGNITNLSDHRYRNSKRCKVESIFYTSRKAEASGSNYVQTLGFIFSEAEKFPRAGGEFWSKDTIKSQQNCL